MSGVLSQFPARDTSFQDKNGQITPVWYRFLFTQWQKTGAGDHTATLADVVEKAGDTMTGPLILSGPPTAPQQAATKQYVDTSTSSPVLSVAGRTGNVVLGYTDISGLATVAHTGAYTDLTGTPITASPATVAPLIDGTAAVGTSLLYARQDHVHPTDTSRAALAGPTFTGVPAAPTAAPGTNTTQLATTAFVAASFAPIASPSFTGNALVAGGIGVWGHAAPGAQPAAPVTLGDVIAIIRGCGLSA